MLYTMKNLQDGIKQIQQGEYVDFEVPAAYHAIIKTQNLGNDWNIFIKNASTSILNAMFEVLAFDDIKNYIEHETQRPPNNQNHFTSADITNMLGHCEVYAQRRDIEVKGTKAHAFIFRTPSAVEYNTARATLVLIVELFRKIGGNLNDTHNIPGVGITIRKDEKFFDVKIDEINDRAWCGFDFR